VNPITNNYARILCRLQYIFYRASFLIVIRIHRGINTTNRSYWSKQQTLAATGATGTTATKPPPERQPPPEPSRSLALELLQHSHWSRSNDSHRATGVDRTTPTGATGTTATGATGTTATGVDRQHWSHCNGSHRSPSNDSHRSRSNDSHSRSCKRQPLESIERATAKFWSCKQQILAPTTQEQQILEPTRVRYRNCWSCE